MKMESSARFLPGEDAEKTKDRERALFMQTVYDRLAESEAAVSAGRKSDAKESLKRIREKYNV